MIPIVINPPKINRATTPIIIPYKTGFFFNFKYQAETPTTGVASAPIIKATILTIGTKTTGTKTTIAFAGKVKLKKRDKNTIKRIDNFIFRHKYNTNS